MTVTEINHRQEDDIDIIKISGKVQINESVQIKEIVSKLLQNGRAKIVFDLQDMEYISGPGLIELIFARKYARQRILPGIYQGDVFLVNMTDRILEVFKLIQYSDVFGIYTTLEEAKLAFQINHLTEKQESE